MMLSYKEFIVDRNIRTKEEYISSCKDYVQYFRDLYGEESIRIQYVREEPINDELRGKPYGVMVALYTDHRIYFGFSCTHSSDIWDRNKGLCLAFDRITKSELMSVPDFMIKDVVTFVSKCNNA